MVAARGSFEVLDWLFHGRENKDMPNPLERILLCLISSRRYVLELLRSIPIFVPDSKFNGRIHLGWHFASAQSVQCCRIDLVAISRNPAGCIEGID